MTSYAESRMLRVEGFRRNTQAVEALLGDNHYPHAVDACHVTRYNRCMIRTFADKQTEQFWVTGKIRRIPPDIARRALRKLSAIDAVAEVEVLRGSGRQVLRHQAGTTSQEEARSFRQGEEESSDLDLEVGQGQRFLPIEDGGHWGACWRAKSTTSDKAARTSRGRTRLSHRSTRRAPSM